MDRGGQIVLTDPLVSVQRASVAATTWCRGPAALTAAGDVWALICSSGRVMEGIHRAAER
jgi:hypothetical protein